MVVLAPPPEALKTSPLHSLAPREDLQWLLHPLQVRTLPVSNEFTGKQGAPAQRLPDKDSRLKNIWTREQMAQRQGWKLPPGAEPTWHLFLKKPNVAAITLAGASTLQNIKLCGCYPACTTVYRTQAHTHSTGLQGSQAGRQERTPEFTPSIP